MMEFQALLPFFKVGDIVRLLHSFEEGAPLKNPTLDRLGASKEHDTMRFAKGEPNWRESFQYDMRRHILSRCVFDLDLDDLVDGLGAAYDARHSASVTTTLLDLDCRSIRVSAASAVSFDDLKLLLMQNRSKLKKIEVRNFIFAEQPRLSPDSEMLKSLEECELRLSDFPVLEELVWLAEVPCPIRYDEGASWAVSPWTRLASRLMRIHLHQSSILAHASSPSNSERMRREGEIHQGHGMSSWTKAVAEVPFCTIRIPGVEDLVLLRWAAVRDAVCKRGQDLISVAEVEGPVDGVFPVRGFWAQRRRLRIEIAECAGLVAIMAVVVWMTSQATMSAAVMDAQSSSSTKSTRNTEDLFLPITPSGTLPIEIVVDKLSMPNDARRPQEAAFIEWLQERAVDGPSAIEADTIHELVKLLGSGLRPVTHPSVPPKQRYQSSPVLKVNQIVYDRPRTLKLDFCCRTEWIQRAIAAMILPDIQRSCGLGQATQMIVAAVAKTWIPTYLGLLFPTSKSLQLMGNRCIPRSPSLCGSCNEPLAFCDWAARVVHEGYKWAPQISPPFSLQAGP